MFKDQDGITFLEKEARVFWEVALQFNRTLSDKQTIHKAALEALSLLSTMSETKRIRERSYELVKRASDLKRRQKSKKIT